MTRIMNIARAAWRRLQRPVVVRRRRQAGIALVVVTVTIAVLGAVVSDFAFNTRVDLEAAANARDTLRAEYLARSGIQLSRLLIKVQKDVLDKIPGVDIQISEYASYLMKAFGGPTDERAGLGALLGIDVSNMKGLGVGKNASFDVTMTSDDGRINLNCGGGINPNPAQAQALYWLLFSMFSPPRYDNPPWRIWGWPDADGQIAQREETACAIVDWTDVDEQHFVPIPRQAGGQAPPSSSGGGAEAYNYDAGRDPYKARNQYFDTLEELNLVRGVGDSFWGSFGELFTVYGGCQVNVAAIPPEKWPILAALIRYSAAPNSNSQVLGDDIQLAALSQKIIGLMQMTGGMLTQGKVEKLIDLINNPVDPTGKNTQTQGALGIQLDPNVAKQVMTLGARRIYRIDSVGTIERTKDKKIQVHIRAIWDRDHYNQNTTSPDPNDQKGTWVYWRQD